MAGSPARCSAFPRASCAPCFANGFCGRDARPRTLSSSQECLDFARLSLGGLCVSSESVAGGRAVNVGALALEE